GRGAAAVSNIEGRRPYLRDADIAVLGIRDADEALAELGAAAIPTWEVSRLRGDGPAGAAHMARARLEAEEVDGFWVPVDADILDPGVMPAVDSPDPDGIGHDELVELLTPLTSHPRRFAWGG